MKKGRKKYKKSNWINAYLSLEASLIVPLIFMLIICFIYLMFFLYDSCLIKQVAYTAALRGSQEKRLSEKEIEQKVNQNIEELIGNRLIMSSEISRVINVSVFQVEVEIQSVVKMPFPNTFIFNMSEWKINEKAVAKRVDPVSYIRGVRKAKEILRD